MPSAPVLRRHFLSWARPWLPQVSAWLAADWNGTGPLDLSHVLAVVPTRQSGRRLRAALAQHAERKGAAVFAPRVMTPDTLVAPEARADVASRPESLLAWTRVFRELDLDTFRAVFPLDPPVRNFSWALRLAGDFARLQSALANGGWRLGDIPAIVGPDFVEAERWQQIAELGGRHDSLLAQQGLREPHGARIELARSPSLDAKYQRIVVLAVPDLAPLVLTRLATLAKSRSVDVVVFAPENEAAAFDAAGRPVPAAWGKRELVLPDFDARTHLCADPAEQGARVAQLAARYSIPAGVLALGVADPEITRLLASELDRLDRANYDPKGRPMRHEALYVLLANLAALARDPEFAAVEALARCPDFLACLQTKWGPGFSCATWLEGLDDLRARHLPADLVAAQQHARSQSACAMVTQGLETMAQIRALLTSGGFAAGTIAALRDIFGPRQLDLSDEADVRWQAAATAWMEVVRDCAAAEKRFGSLGSAESWDLALRLFGETTVPANEKPAGALELQGWLELLWEEAPHLAVAGLNDGRVPEAVPEDGFLPASLRQRLGLETNETRDARDAYILQAIAAGRAHGGRIDFFFGKTSAVGDPLKPSRLLLRCADRELPNRVAWLFREPALAPATPPWTRAWKLQPRVAPPPARVAVTALRRYLACPFRFYLRHVLGMDRVDPLKSELDAFDFGTLCHAALEQIGLDPGLRDCADPAVLCAGLWHHLERAVRVRYGENLSLPLLVQVESARQRLGKVAERQAAERAAGWQIIEVERPFELEVAGLLVRGRIDRIDRHDTTGVIRVLDYKTSDLPVTPAAAHFRVARPAEPLAEWARFDFQGRPRTWMDLQLPIYLRALRPAYSGPLVGGYFNLPKAAGETVLALWEEYSRELQEAAMRCAEGACAAIRAGEFWPPSETIRAERDEWAGLFHHGSAASVEWPTR